MLDDRPHQPQSRGSWWLVLVLVPVVIVGTGLVQAALMPPPVPATTPMKASATDDLNRLLTALATPQAITVTLPETLVVVTPEPEPTPVLPTPDRPPGPDICTAATPKGDVCKQPLPPKPPPTEVPDCPVAPNKLCVSTGQAIEHLPTPTPDPNAFIPGGEN